MRNYDPYRQAELMGEWFRSQANKMPRPLSDAELEAMEKRATDEWEVTSADVLRLAAEVRGLRASVKSLREEIASTLKVGEALLERSGTGA